MTARPADDLLRETLARLEARTAALEAAILSGAPDLALVQTPTARTTSDTPRALRPPAPRPPRVPPASADAHALTPGQVLESLDDVVWSVSPDGKLVFFLAGGVERLYGLTAHELQDRRGRWLDAVWPDDREKVRAALARTTDAGTLDLEHRVLRPDGAVRWAVTRGRLVRDPDGRPLRIDGLTRDVTRAARPREAVLDALRALGADTGPAFVQKLVRSLCEVCEVRAAVVVEPSGPSAARVTVGWAAGAPLDPFEVPAGSRLTGELLAGGRVQLSTAARARHPSDPLLLALRAEGFAAEPLADATGKLIGFLAVADDRPLPAGPDVSAVLRALAPRAAAELARAPAPAPDSDARLKAAEARAEAAEGGLRDAAQLAAAGRLAAGVAHDFHNLLGVIAGNADLVREALPPDHPRRECAEAIARTAHTVAGISRQLVAVGKPAAPAPEPLDVAAAVRALEPMLARLCGRRVALGLDLAPDLPLVRSDPTDFDRVVLNLVLNARDASPRGGSITIRAALDADAPARPDWPPELPAGGYVAVTVADQGCGMTPEVKARMFDLFFTTKGAAGSGVGLAAVRDVVRAAGGHIEVESEPAWGTAVRVFWPALE